MTDDEKVILARIDERLKGHMETTARWQGETGRRIKVIEVSTSKDNVRLDRIEQRDRGRAPVVWAAVSASVVAAVGAIKSWFDIRPQ